MSDKRFEHLHIEDAFDEIDARLFTGMPKPDELDAIQEYIDRWGPRISELRKSHASENASGSIVRARPQ